MSLEIRTRQGWIPIARRPAVLESDSIELRGHRSDSVLTLGNAVWDAGHPTARIRLIDDDELRCHIGLLPLAVDGHVVGEIDVRPGKLSEENWNTLRRELDAVWTGLLLDDPAHTALEATGPDPAAMWRQLGPVVADLATHPVRTLGTHERWMRRERARSASELTVSVALAGMRGKPGRARTTAPVIAEAERALVRDCLQRLQAYARRQPSGRSVATAVSRFLATDPFAQPSRSAVAVTHLARHEPRLRQVVSVRQVLLNTSSLITEGPGELRLGVKGLDKLYEYWVFLKVLQQLRLEFGEPIGAGFEQLAVRLPGGRLRLELPAGTSVEFPNGVHAAFAPRVTQGGRNSWRGLELAAMPPSTGINTPLSVEPDIVVQCDAADGEVVVIDAKYRARQNIDHALWEVHQKYGRFRQNGRGVVSTVVVAHPHETLTLRWAGQAAVPFVPGGSVEASVWPSSWRPHRPAYDTSVLSDDGRVDDAPTPDTSHSGAGAVVITRPAVGTPPPPPVSALQGEALRTPRTPETPTSLQSAPTTAPSVRVQDVDLVICDQQWTYTARMGRRLDLLALRMNASINKPSYLIGANQGTLVKFHEAAYHRGWKIAVTVDRAEFLDKVDELLERYRPGVVTIISGLSDVIELIRARGCVVDILDDLDDMMLD